jgi:hypothetical protein
MDTPDISKLDDFQQLALARQLATDIRSSLPMELCAGSFTSKSKLPFKAASFREVLIHRLSDLADISIELYETDRLVPAFLTTRGVVETVAMMYRLHCKTTKFLESKDKIAYDEFLMKGMLGSRDGTTCLESYNILSAVDPLNKEFKGFRKMFDTLCEFTHPNWSGTMGSYSKINSETYTLHLGKSHQKPPVAFGLGPLVASLVVFMNYYNDLADKLKTVNDRFERG